MGYFYMIGEGFVILHTWNMHHQFKHTVFAKDNYSCCLIIYYCESDCHFLEISVGVPSSDLL